MKKVLSAVLTLCLVALLAAVISIFSFAAEPALEKDGDGFYKINSFEDLVEFRKNYVERYEGRLYADIDATGREWTPWTTGEKLLHFDGNGHKITGLSYTFEDNDGNNYTTRGLFTSLLANGNFSSWVKNLTFENCTLTVNITDGSENNRFGITTAHLDRGAVENVNYDGCTITVNGNNKGYFVGFAAGWSEWNFNDDGVIVSGNVTNSTVNANGAWGRVGGLVGRQHYDSLMLRDSAVDFTVNKDKDSTVVYAYVGEISGDCNTVILGSGLSNRTAYAETPVSPKVAYTVSTADELIALVAKINNGEFPTVNGDRVKTGIRLANDIDLTGKEWTPITVPYVGTFHGQGHTIRGIRLVYNDVTGGDFGMIANKIINGGGNGRIQDLTLEDCSLTIHAKEGVDLGTIRAGGFAGFQDRGLVLRDTLKNSHITVNGNFTGESAVGGMVGRADWDYDNGVSVEWCSVDENSTVTANGENVVVAGLLGIHGSSDRLDVNRSSCAGTIRGNYITAGLVGVGSVWGEADNAIYNSTFSGTVIGRFAAGAYGNINTGKMRLQNTQITGRICGFEQAAGYSLFGNLGTNDECSCQVAFFKELGAESFDAYLQTMTVEGASTQDIRLVLIANVDALNNCAGITMTAKFTLEDGSVKTYTGVCNSQKSDWDVCYSIEAAGESYEAAAGSVIFGNVFTGAPLNVASVSLSIVDADGTTVYSGTAEVNR